MSYVAFDKILSITQFYTFHKMLSKSSEIQNKIEYAPQPNLICISQHVLFD